MPGEVAQRRSALRKPRRGPPERLRDALLALAGHRGEIARHSERAWASITFSGTRHTVTMKFTGNSAIAAGEALIAALPDHEFAIPGQLVADATVTATEHTLLPGPELTVECELLLLEDA